MHVNGTNFSIFKKEMKKRRLIGPLTPIQEQQEVLKDVGLPEDLIRKVYDKMANQKINGKMEGYWEDWGPGESWEEHEINTYVNGKSMVKKLCIMRMDGF